MRVAGKEVFRPGIKIGEVAASTAGNADLFRRFFGMVEQQHGTTLLRGGEGAHHAGRASTDDDRVPIAGGRVHRSKARVTSF